MCVCVCARWCVFVLDPYFLVSFHVTVIKIPEEKQPKGQRACSGSQFKRVVHHGGRGKAGRQLLTAHHQFTENKERFLPFSQPRILCPQASSIFPYQLMPSG